MPEDLDRILRDPEIAIEFDWEMHRALREWARSDPESFRPTREAYLNLWALIEREVPEP